MEVILLGYYLNLSICNKFVSFFKGNAIVTERGCAQQSFSYRVLKRGQWQTINDVNETIYQDGCILEHQGTKPPTQYCYCSSRLCNAASTVQSNLLICFFLLLVYYIL